ncbi:angiopoietin-related protein 3-like [Pelobates fuscus]|uniref:angiopoietin-related protein 3-like n=1 Tax=Pelobates fuscus TaxID=191477 RepID=UPI002FE46F2E
MFLLLLLLGLVATPWEVEGRAALNEDVNVLVYGTVQLGQAVGNTYSSTAEKLQRVEDRRSRQEKNLEKLQEEVARARQEERRLAAEVERLQSEEEEIRSLSSVIMLELRDLQKGYEELKTRVRSLENVLPDALALKAQVERQHLTLQVVAEAVNQQQEQIANQRIQLNHILKKASITD